MTTPIDIETLPPPAQKILGAGAPVPLRKMAAKGVAPGLKPAAALAVVFLLAEGDDAEVAKDARATLAKLPAPLLSGAIGPELHPTVIDAIAPSYARDPEVMERLLGLQQIASSTVAAVAKSASEAVAELIATNESRLLEHPGIISALYMNKSTRMSTADRILELAVRNGVELDDIPAFKEAAQAIANELIPVTDGERTPDDALFDETDRVAEETDFDPNLEDTHALDEETGEEVVDQKFATLDKKLGEMTVSQKIRRAMLGTASERSMLVRDRNRLVAAAAIKSPLIQENEVVRISASRNVSDEVLRIIASSRDWTKSHQIKLNLVENPRTPFAFTARLIPHLREHELKKLAKSKNVPGPVIAAARQQLARKTKR